MLANQRLGFQCRICYVYTIYYVWSCQTLVFLSKYSLESCPILQGYVHLEGEKIMPTTMMFPWQQKVVSKIFHLGKK